MNRHRRKLFSWTVLAGMIFNLLSPLFLLPWQQVFACFGSWDCGGNAYCAGAGSYPDHPGSCASYGERGNNDRTTSEIAQDYINSGGNPAEVVTRTSDFQGRSSNDDAAAAAAKAQELAVAEAQRIAAEQAAAANAAANAAAAKAADDKTKAESQRLAQEAAERSARAAANAAAAAAAMTPLSGAVPAGTPAVGATVPATAAPVAAEAACGSSLHNACSPNSDGNWYRCNNGSWQSAPDCKPAGAINCVSGCAGANGCMPEGTPATYNGVEKVCGEDDGKKGRWIDKSTVPPVISQKPNLAEAIDEALEAQYINPPIAIRPPATPTARPIAAAPTTAVAPPTSAPIPTAPAQQTAQEQNQEQNLERFRCRERGGTWTNDNTCQSPGRPSPTIAPNPTAVIRRPVLPTLVPLPTAVIRRPVNPTLIPAPPTPVPTAKQPDYSDESRFTGLTIPTPLPTAGQAVLPEGYRCSEHGGELIDGECRIGVKTETKTGGGGVFGREVKVTTKTFCSGNSAVTQTSRSGGMESTDSTVCEWGCVGGACRPPTIQETAVVRMEVINNAIDQAKVRCQRSGKTNCSTVAVYADAMQNVDAREPSQVQADIIRDTASKLSPGDRKALINQEYNNLRSSILQAQAAGSGQGLTFGTVGLTVEDEAGLRRQAEKNVDRILNSGNVDAGGGNILTADSNKWDMISNLPVDQAEAIIATQKGAEVAGIEIPGWGRSISKAMFCSLNDDYRRQHRAECGWGYNPETVQSFWSFLISGKSEQGILDLGMVFGNPRSAEFQVREYDDKVAPKCGVRSSEGELTDEEYDCLVDQTAAALYRWDTVDDQNLTNAALNVTSAALGFGAGAIGAGIKATSLAGKAGTIVLRSGAVSDLILTPLNAEAMTAGDRAEADVLTALAEADDIPEDQRVIRQARAEAARAANDDAYKQNLIFGAFSAVTFNLGGEGLGAGARQVLGDTPLGRLLLGNLDVPAGRAAAAEVADEANRVIVGGDGTVWNVKPEVVNPRTALQEGELLIISPGERNARTATAAELVNLPEESLVWHRSPDGDEVLHIADSRGDLHVVEPRQRTGQAGGTAGPRAVSAVDIEGVADRVVTTEDVVSAARDTRAALRGETDVLGEQAVVAGVNVPAGVEVGEAAAVARTAIGGQGGIGGIADKAADTAAAISYDAAGIVDRAGAAVNSALAEDGIVGRAIAGVEQPITNFGRRMEAAVDGAVRSAGEAIDAAKVRIAGQGVLQTEAVAGKIVDLDDVYSSTVNLKDLQGKTVVISPGDSFETPNYGDGFRVPVSPREIGGQTGDLIYYQLTIDGLGQPPQLLTGSGIPIPISRDTNIEIKFKAFSPTADPPDNLVSTIIHNVNNNSRIDNATRPPLTNGVQLGPVVYRGWRDISGDLQMPIVRTPAPAAIIVDPNLNTSIPVPISSRTTNVVLGDREIIIGQVDNGYIYFGVDNAPPYLTNSPQSIFDIDGKQYIVVVEVGKGIGGLDNLRRQANVTLVPADGARVAGIKISGTEVSPGGRSQTEVWDKEILFDPTKIQKAEMVYESDIGTMHRSFDFGQALGVVEAQSEIGLALVDGKAKNLRVEIEGVDGGITTYRISGPYRVELIIRGAGDPIEFTPRGNSVVVPLNSGGGVGIATRIQSEIGSWADSVRWGRKNAPAAGVALSVEENIALPREGKSYLIGRSSKSDITTVNSAFTNYVSREHVRITNEGSNVFTVADLDSTYGTYILRSGGEPIRVDPNAPIPLVEGDIIRLGNPESGYAEFDFAGRELNGPFYDRSANTGIGAGREGAGGGEEIIPAERTPEGIGGKVRNAVGEAGERIGEVVSGVREKVLSSKMVVSEPEWNEKTIGIDGLQAEVDSLVRQAKGQGMPPGTKITISYFGDDSKLKIVHTKLETLAVAIRNALENNQFGAQFGDLYIKFGNSGVELGSVSNLSDPQNIAWNVRDIPTKAELNYLITHSADFRQKVALARDIGTIGISAAIGATIAVTGFDISMYNFYYKPTTDKVPLKDPEAALRDMRNLPPNDFRCVGNQIVEISATTDEVLQALETCQNGCSLGMCRARETAACQPGEHLRVSDSLESCSLSCVNGVYTKDFAQCDAIDLSGISTNRYREVVMQTLSILPDDFFPVDKFDKLSIYEVPLAYFSRGDIGDFSPEVNWRDQDIELNGMASQTGEHLLIGRESLSEGLASGVSGTLIHELLHLWASQSVKPLPEGVPYSFVASIPAEILSGGAPFGYSQVTGCLNGGAGSAFHDQPVDIRAVNCGEDFAYAGTQYVLEACQLKNYSPERYEYFKNEVFRGKEYIPENGCPSQGGG